MNNQLRNRKVESGKTRRRWVMVVLLLLAVALVCSLVVDLLRRPVRQVFTADNSQPQLATLQAIVTDETERLVSVGSVGLAQPHATSTPLPPPIPRNQGGQDQPGAKATATPLPPPIVLPSPTATVTPEPTPTNTAPAFQPTVTPTQPPPATQTPTPTPPPTATSSPIPTPTLPRPLPTPTATIPPPPKYSYVLSEIFTDQTSNHFLTGYIAIVNNQEVPIGGMKVIGRFQPGDIYYETALSNWFFEGYSAPGAVLKSGSVKFEPGGIQKGTWSLHLANEQGDRFSDDVLIHTDPAHKEWFFIKFKDVGSKPVPTARPQTVAQGNAAPTQPPQPALTLEQTVSSNQWNDDGDQIAEAGETISYDFKVTNSGAVPLQQVRVEAPQVVVDCAPFDGWLEPAASAQCSGTYTLTQTDLDARRKESSARAIGADAFGSQIFAQAAAVAVTLPAKAAIQLVQMENESGWNDDGDGMAEAGETVNYRFTVSNAGNISLQGVALSGPQLSFDCGDFGGWLQPGTGVVCTGRYPLTQADIDAGVTKSDAAVAGTDQTGSPVQAKASASINLPVTPNLGAQSSVLLNDADNDGIAEAGETVNHSLTLSNNGNVTLQRVSVTDRLVKFECAGFGGTLAPAEQVVCQGSYTLAQADIDAGLKENTTTVKGSGPKNVSVTATVTAEVILPPQPALTLNQSGQDKGDKPVKAGETINFTLTLTNNGNVTLQKVSPSYSLGDVKCERFNGTLAPAKAVTCKGSYRLTQADIDGGTLVATAGVSGTDPDQEPLMAETLTTFSLTGQPGLAAQQEGVFNDLDGDQVADAGETIAYRLTALNTGNVTLQKVRVHNSWVVFECEDFAGTLAPAEEVACSGSYRLTQADLDAGKHAVPVRVGGIDPDGGPVTSLAPITVTLASRPQLTAQATGLLNDVDGDGLAEAGETISYTLAMTNSGNITLKALTANDPQIAYTCAGYLGRIAPQESVLCRGSYTLTQPLIDAGTLETTVQTSALDANGAEVLAESSVSLSLAAQPALRVSQAGLFRDDDGDGRAEVSETVHYRLVVRNSGNVTLQGLTVNDPQIAFDCGDFSGTLAPMERLACSSHYPLTQADIDAGQKENTTSAGATDPAGGRISAERLSTVRLAAEPAFKIQSGSTFADEDGDGITEAGETIEFSLVISNDGNVTLNEIAIQDPMVMFDCPGFNGRLAPNEQVSCSARYPLTQHDIDSGEVRTTALTLGSTPNGSDHTADTSTAIALVPRPRLEAELLGLPNLPADDTAPQAGHLVSFSLVVSNSGNITLNEVAVEKAEIIFDCGDFNGVLAPQEQALCQGHYELTQGDLDTGQIASAAAIKAIDLNGEKLMIRHSAVLSLTAQPALVLQQDGMLNDEDGDRVAEAGETLSYNLTVTNGGNVTLAEVTINDPQVSFVCQESESAEGAFTPGDRFTCTGIYTLTQRDIDAGLVKTVTTANGHDPVEQPVTGDGVATVELTAQPGLVGHLARTFNDGDGDQVAEAGKTIGYTLTITNSGNVTLQRVTVQDPQVRYNCQNFKGILGPGQTTLCQADYRLNQTEIDAGSVETMVTVSGNDPQNEPIAWSTPDAVMLAFRPGLEVQQAGVFNDEDSDGLAEPDETITYRLTVANRGNVTLRRVTVSDPLIVLDCAGFDGILAPKAQTICTASYAITQPDIDAAQVETSARAGGVDPLGNQVTAGAANPVKLPTQPSLTLQRTDRLNDPDEDAAVEAGETIDSTLTLTNAGNVTLHDVVVSDPLVTFDCGNFAGILAPREYVVCSSSHRLTQAEIDAGQLATTTTGQSVDPSGDLVTAESTGVVILPSQPALTIQPTALFSDENGDALAQVGETITFTYRLTNVGNVSLNEVTFSSENSAIGRLGTISCGSTSFGDPFRNDGADSLDVAESVGCSTSFTIAQADIDAGQVEQTLTGRGTDLQGGLTSTMVPVSVALPQVRSLYLVKTLVHNTDEDHSGTVTFNDTLTYEFMANNDGNVTLVDLLISDPLVEPNQIDCTPEKNGHIILLPGESIRCTATEIAAPKNNVVTSGSR